MKASQRSSLVLDAKDAGGPFYVWKLRSLRRDVELAMVPFMLHFKTWQPGVVLLMGEHTEVFLVGVLFFESCNVMDWKDVISPPAEQLRMITTKSAQIVH